LYYGKYWKEADLVVDLVAYLRKQLPARLETHLNVTLNPTDWDTIAQQNERRKRWPQIDLVILDPSKKEGDEKPFSLLAEVKFSYPTKNLNKRTLQRAKEIQKDIRRLKKYKKAGICREAFFCYLDEYHVNKLRERMRRLIHRECGKMVTGFYQCPSRRLRIGEGYGVEIEDA
jgi:hypothetical protein